MKKKIKVAVKFPKSNPHILEVPNTLAMFQSLVWGYIETYTTGDIVIIVDEEGRPKGKPHNCVFHGVDFVGPMVFCGVDGEDFADIPYTEEEFKEKYPELYEEETNDNA